MAAPLKRPRLLRKADGEEAEAAVGEPGLRRGRALFGRARAPRAGVRDAAGDVWLRWLRPWEALRPDRGDAMVGGSRGGSPAGTAKGLAQRQALLLNWKQRKGRSLVPPPRCGRRVARSGGRAVVSFLRFLARRSFLAVAAGGRAAPNPAFSGHGYAVGQRWRF